MAIIKIENLSKKYIIGHDKAATGSYKYKSLRDSLAHTARGIGQRLLHPLSTNTETTDIEEFWALKDINLEIEQGDKVGIIGRNGAGKSTLLKILSRITEPTTGKVTMNGRVASLLEVGTGFHPELTGRENIYLNGAVLGMTRKEIKKKFDEIIDFAGVEKFLDTPVKRFSSGMYVRLAFAVAAHLDPEILLIDEVLAVGDAEFQKKCLGKMDEVSKQGRTILFVSHNMSAIESFCSRVITLNLGNKMFDGAVSIGVDTYLSDTTNNLQCNLKERKDRAGTQTAKIVNIKVYRLNNSECYTIKSGEDYFFKIHIINLQCNDIENIEFSLDFFDERFNKLLLFRSNFTTNNRLNLKTGDNILTCQINKFPLTVGKYFISLFLGQPISETIDHLSPATSIIVEGGDFFGTGSEGMPSQCKILHNSKWTIS